MRERLDVDIVAQFDQRRALQVTQHTALQVLDDAHGEKDARLDTREDATRLFDTSALFQKTSQINRNAKVALDRKS